MTGSTGGWRTGTGLPGPTGRACARRCSRAARWGEPHLAPAAHGLTAQVLAGRFRALRWSRMLGWADLGLGIGLGATGVAWLSTRGHPEGVLLPVLGVVNAGLLLCAGGVACLAGATADPAPRGAGPAGPPGRGLVPGRGGSGAQAARELLACAERTLAAPAGRIKLHREFSWPQAAWPRPRGCRGKVLRLAVKGGKVLVSTGWKLATRRLETTRGQEFGHLIGEGVAEPARGRYLVGFGSFAELHAGGTTYGRRSGRSVQVMHPMPDLAQAEDVLWLLRLLPGVTGAAVDGTNGLHGTACRRLAAHVDMQRASAATEGGLRPPPVKRFEQLRALPLTAWINGQHARRIQFEHGAPAPHRTTLELWDVGVPVENLDWSQLPAFRSPGYEHEPKPWYQRVLRKRNFARHGGATRSPQ